MTRTMRRILLLWTAALVLALLIIIPLSGGTRTMAALVVVCLGILGWIRADRRAAHLFELFSLHDGGSLPPAAYRQPVILVCGDSLSGLFGAVPDEHLAVRTTAQGCYIRIPALERLPEMAAGIEALRPDWSGQLSVMIIVNPGEYSDNDELSCRLRTFCYQLSVLFKRGMTLPLMLVSYLPSSQGEGAWFTWEDGQPGPTVRVDGTVVTLADWQRQVATEHTHCDRLRCSVQLSSAAAWLGETVLPQLALRDALPLACAITWAPSMPRNVSGNLWQQWLQGKTALVDASPAALEEGALLAFPDPLLRLLPTRFRSAPTLRMGVVAFWIFGLACLVAMGSSAWQNKLLLRQVTDDLRRYSVITEPERRDQPEFAQREEALTALRNDAIRLDNYYRQGEPLALGMGLYRGELLRVPLLNLIASHRQPPAAMAPAQPGHPVRLDSLSLFRTGSAQLKPESTKVLIEALVDIKAQPGWLIVITGHTDATGGAPQNLQLSLARAAAVRDWMQRMGSIPDSCFAIQGLGATQPVARNDSEIGRTANRRVDIRLVPETGACTPLAAATGQTTPVASRDVQ